MSFSLTLSKENQPPAKGKIGDVTSIPEDLDVMCILWVRNEPGDRITALQIAERNRLLASTSGGSE